MKIQFYYCDNEWLRNGFSRYGLFFSQQFCEFFSKNFIREFYNGTGLRPSTKVTLAGYKQHNDTPIYQPGSVSKLNLVLWIMPEYNDNISFCWKSKSGRIITPTEENFNEDDVKCWIDGLKPLEYWKQVATQKKSHPFEIQNLSYDLKVFDFGVEMILRIYAKNNYSIIKEVISNTIEKFNILSEADSRKNGVVHTHRFVQKTDHFVLQIDTGSAGIEIIKKILKEISKINTINRVEVDI